MRLTVVGIAVSIVLLGALAAARNKGAGAPPADSTPFDSGPQQCFAVRATSPYAPVGTLADGDGRIMQLYARPSDCHRDRWNYHTLVDDSRIPVELTYNGRRCGNDRIGCDRVYTGDTMSATELGSSPPLRVQLYGD